MGKNAVGDHYSHVYLPNEKQIHYACNHCGRVARSPLLISVHVFNRHRFEQKQTMQLGFLGGLLPPKPQEHFRRTKKANKKQSRKSSAKSSPIAKPNKQERQEMVENMRKLIEQWVKTGKLGNNESSVKKTKKVSKSGQSKSVSSYKAGKVSTRVQSSARKSIRRVLRA